MGNLNLKQSYIPKMFDSTGAAGLMKEGSRHYSGLEEAMCRNIDACK